ncbi:MAG: hypothetical protein GY938_12435, partial [Ketobacter sp.]|nr:hypothetical protein [Ketobacter sp.]
ITPIIPTISNQNQNNNNITPINPTISNQNNNKFPTISNQNNIPTKFPTKTFEIGMKAFIKSTTGILKLVTINEIQSNDIIIVKYYRCNKDVSIKLNQLHNIQNYQKILPNIVHDYINQTEWIFDIKRFFDKPPLITKYNKFTSIENGHVYEIVNEIPIFKYTTDLYDDDSDQQSSVFTNNFNNNPTDNDGKELDIINEPNTQTHPLKSTSLTTQSNFKKQTQYHKLLTEKDQQLQLFKQNEILIQDRLNNTQRDKDKLLKQNIKDIDEKKKLQLEILRLSQLNDQCKTKLKHYEKTLTKKESISYQIAKNDKIETKIHSSQYKFNGSPHSYDRIDKDTQIKSYSPQLNEITSYHNNKGELYFVIIKDIVIINHEYLVKHIVDNNIIALKFDMFIQPQKIYDLNPQIRSMIHNTKWISDLNLFKSNPPTLKYDRVYEEFVNIYDITDHYKLNKIGIYSINNKEFIVKFIHDNQYRRYQTKPINSNITSTPITDKVLRYTSPYRRTALHSSPQQNKHHYQSHPNPQQTQQRISSNPQEISSNNQRIFPKPQGLTSNNNPNDPNEPNQPNNNNEDNSPNRHSVSSLRSNATYIQTHINQNNDKTFLNMQHKYYKFKHIDIKINNHRLFSQLNIRFMVDSSTSSYFDNKKAKSAAKEIATASMQGSILIGNQWELEWDRIYTTTLSKISISMIGKNDKYISKYDVPYKFNGTNKYRLIDTLKKFLNWAFMKKIPVHKLYGIFCTDVLQYPATNILNTRQDLQQSTDLVLLINVLHEEYPSRSKLQQYEKAFAQFKHEDGQVPYKHIMKYVTMIEDWIEERCFVNTFILNDSHGQYCNPLPEKCILWNTLLNSITHINLRRLLAPYMTSLYETNGYNIGNLAIKICEIWHTQMMIGNTPIMLRGIDKSWGVPGQFVNHSSYNNSSTPTYKPTSKPTSKSIPYKPMYSKYSTKNGQKYKLKYRRKNKGSNKKTYPQKQNNNYTKTKTTESCKLCGSKTCQGRKGINRCQDKTKRNEYIKKNEITCNFCLEKTHKTLDCYRRKRYNENKNKFSNNNNKYQSNKNKQNLHKINQTQNDIEEENNIIIEEEEIPEDESLEPYYSPCDESQGDESEHEYEPNNNNDTNSNDYKSDYDYELDESFYKSSDL